MKTLIAFSVLILGIACAALAAEPPLKVLVIGGPGPGHRCREDAVLAEMLARAYGWETRYAMFYTEHDESPDWHTLGKRKDIQRQSFEDILRLLNDWRPAVTLARLPRKDYSAITPEIQKALVERVNGGMGLVAWANNHGSVDYEGEPLAGVLPGRGFGADYSGSTSDSTWRWAVHRLNFGLPMDQQVHQQFFDIPGKAADFKATDLVLTDREDSGRIRVREAGQGRVVMLGHSTVSALGPLCSPQQSEPFTMEVMHDRPDWGEIHLRLIQRCVLWARGEQLDQRVAINIPPLNDDLQCGGTREIPLQVLNETGRALQADVWAAVDGAPPALIGKLTAPPGQSEQKVSVPFPGQLRGGWVPFEVSLRNGTLVLGSPPAVALRYARVAWPVETAISADRRGAPRGGEIVFTAKLKRGTVAEDGPVRLVWTLNDYQQRVLTAHQEDVVFSKDGEATSVFRWTLPDLDATHYRYLARATVLRGTTLLGDATLAVYRAERYRLSEGIYHGIWSDLYVWPEAIVPSILDLYADAGCRAVCTALDQFQIFYQEQRNWRGYFETFGNQVLTEWSLLSNDEALQKARADVARMFRRVPLQDSGAFPVISLGEESGLILDGASLCDTPEDMVKPEVRAEVRRGYLKYLEKTYGTIQQLNAQWEKNYASWEQVEMPWKYFNFCYPDKARPAKGVINVSQAVDQWGYLRETWQRAYDAHTRALQEALPTTRTLLSTGDFYGTKLETPDETDTGHQFGLEWAGTEDAEFNQKQFGKFLVKGVTFAAYWFDIPLVFNPDLTHTRASKYRRAELNRALERAPLILHAQQLAPTPQVVVQRPQGPYSGEFYSLLGNNLADSFLPHTPLETWRQLCHMSGIFPSEQISPQTRLVVLPLAVTLSAEQAAQLAAFVSGGGTLLATCGLAQYNLRGKPYGEYPGAGLTNLLGLKLAPDHTKSRRAKWTLSAWPRGKVPEVGVLFSGLFCGGRDGIVQQATNVQVLGKYEDGTPALLYRKVGRGQVLYFNGVYDIGYTHTSDSMPFWSNMGGLMKALLDLAGVKSADLNVVDSEGRPFEEPLPWNVGGGAAWNVAGAGTNQPGAQDIVYVRVLGNLDSTPVRVVSKRPVAFARDALTDQPLKVEKNGKAWSVPLPRGPAAAHYVALFPYQPAKMVLTPKQSEPTAGTILDLKVQIFDLNGNRASGRHAVTLHALLDGQLVTQWREIQGEGWIPLPLSARDAGRVTIKALDWTSGLRAQTTVAVKPGALVADLPAALPHFKRGMPPRALDDSEVVATLNRLARVYALGPTALQCADEAKWRLGYYTFLLDESRHNLAGRLLVPSSWNPAALRKALAAGARWILSGEDLGLDRLQGQALSPHDHIGQLSEALAGAERVQAVAGAPDQVVYRFNGGGQVLLDRRSFDYWPAEAAVSQTMDWDGKAVVTRTATSRHSGSSQQFNDAYRKWWADLKAKGLLDGTPNAKALLPVPHGFALRDWWQNGFNVETRKRILTAEAQLGLPPNHWEPPAELGGYQLVKVLFADDFATKNDRWVFDGSGGPWRWSAGRMEHHLTSRLIEEKWPDSVRAVMADVADPQATPLLIEACGRMTFLQRYGRFGVCGGYIPKERDSGLICGIRQTALFVGAPPDEELGQPKAVDDLLQAWDADVQFVVLLDGKTIRAKIWNWGLQPEPKDWQYQGTLEKVKLGSALMLDTNIGGYWNRVRIWQLKKS